MIRSKDLSADERRLVEAARGARRHAYAPYSGFKVGAALRTRDGRIFAGCNVENASLGGSICAERGAVMQAVAQGMRRGGLVAIAVYTTDRMPTPPCGMCLQVLVEFGTGASVLLAHPRGVQRFGLAELLPHPFVTYPRSRSTR